MSYEYWQVTVVDILVHDNAVAPGRAAQVYQVFRVLRVMAYELTGIVKLVKQLFSEYAPHLLLRCPGVESVRYQQKYVLLFHAGGIQLFK